MVQSTSSNQQSLFQRAKRFFAVPALLAASAISQSYISADEPKDPATMTQAEWEAYTKKENEKAAAEEARLDAEAAKKATDAADAQAKLDAIEAARKEAETHRKFPHGLDIFIPANRESSFIRGYADLQMGKSGHREGLDGKLVLTDDLSANLSLGNYTLKTTEGGRDVTRAERSINGGITGNGANGTTILFNYYGDTAAFKNEDLASIETLTDEFNNLTTTTSGSNKTSSKDNGLAIYFRQNVNRFSFGVSAFSHRYVQRDELSEDVATDGTASVLIDPPDSYTTIDVHDVTHVDSNTTSTTTTQGGVVGLEYIFNDDGSIDAGVRGSYTDEKSMVSNNGTTLIHDHQGTTQLLGFGRYKLVELELGGNFIRGYDSKNRFIGGVRAVIPLGDRVMVMGHGAMSHSEGRGEGGVWIAVNPTGDYTPTDASNWLAYEGESYRAKDDLGLSTLQLKQRMFDSLADRVNFVPGVVFGGQAINLGQRQYHYKFTLAGKIPAIKGLSGAAEVEVGNSYKEARGRLTENLFEVAGVPLSAYLEGSFERDTRAGTDRKEAGIGIIIGK